MKRDWLFPVFLMVLATGAQAGETLNDPLKPPAILMTPEAQGAVVGARLTSVMLPGANGGGPARAIIDGQLVKVGGAVGDAKLVRLTAQQAVLQGPGGRETLSLTPGVEKKMQLETRKDRKAPKRRKDKQ